MESLVDVTTESVIPDMVRLNLARNSRREKTTQEILNDYSHSLDQVADWVLEPNNTLRVTDMKGLLPELSQDSIERIGKALYSDNPVIIIRAVDALSAVGPDAVPLCIETLESGHTLAASRAGKVMKKIGEDAVPELRELCKGDDVSKSAVLLLAQYDLDAVGQLETFIVEALSSQDQMEARFAIDAILSVGDRLLGLLLELMGSADPFAQQNATNALIELGEMAVPDLVDELDSPNPNIQQNAMRALREIGPVAIERLNEAIDEGSALLQQNALAVLKTINKTGRRSGWFRR